MCSALSLALMKHKNNALGRMAVAGQSEADAKKCTCDHAHPLIWKEGNETLKIFTSVIVANASVRNQ